MYNSNYKNTDEDKYCTITEQGDLGLGADVLCESDQEEMKKNEKNNANK